MRPCCCFTVVAGKPLRGSSSYDIGGRRVVGGRELYAALAITAAVSKYS